MISLARPEALLFVFLLPLLWPLLKSPPLRLPTALRVAFLLTVLLCLAGPRVLRVSRGVDVVVAVDRSASVGPDGTAASTEILQLLERAQGPYDRLAVVGFAAGEPRVERGLDESQGSGGGLLDTAGSELAAALACAARIASPLRQSRVLLISDGMYTGPDPLAARQLSELGGLQVWHRFIGRSTGGDAGAGRILLPGRTLPGNGFLVRFSLFAQSEARPVKYQLHRGEHLLSSGEITLPRGESWFTVRDLINTEGTAAYTLTVEAKDDPVPENNTASALLTVKGAPRVLLATPMKEGGVLESLLAGSGISVDRVKPEAFGWTPAELAPYRVVILENCPLSLIGRQGALALAEAVDKGVSSLLVTGGQGSFGSGGYHRSPLDPLLPVTMELREEQRRGLMGLAIVLDRSGSMTAPVGGGKNKMDLANLSSAEAIRLLSPQDQVAVIAVDSSPHLIVPMSVADDTSALIRAVLRIESMGGGIFVHTGLTAALAELEKSTSPTRHILLFSDAADSEEQEGCQELAARMVTMKIGISVIGLGSRKDCDGPFLEALAATGKGEVVFTDNALELPRLFSQEVIRIARRGFIEEATPTVVLPDILELGVAPEGDLTAGPVLGGYSLTSMREGGSCMLVTGDEYKAPVLAIRRKGRASCGVITAEVDGPFSGGLHRWDQAAPVILGLVRRLAGDIHHAEVKAYSEQVRGEALLRLEFEEETARELRGREEKALFLAPDGSAPQEAVLEWTGLTTATASVTLRRTGHTLPVVDLGPAGIITAPAVTLPYAAEFFPPLQLDGRQVLEELSERSGGGSPNSLGQLFEEEGLTSRRAATDLEPLLAALALLLLLLEMAERRLSLFTYLLKKTRRE